MRGIEAANQQHLYGVFGDAQWTNKDRLPDALLKDLIEHFSALQLGNRRVSSDIIGDAYEYLIKQFADATNKKAGEFYTPRSVVRLMVDILDPQEGETVYDPACGTGGMLLAAVAHVRETGRRSAHLLRQALRPGEEPDHRLGGAHEPAAARHRGLRRSSAATRCAIPIFTDPATGGLATFDCVIANPPFSLKQWGREIWENDPWGRAFAGLPSDNSGDFAWVQHMVTSMAAGDRPHGGGVAPGRALSRRRRGPDPAQAAGRWICIEAVIGLAPNLFYGTGLAACILVLRQRKAPARAGQVLIVDASSLFRKGRAQNFLDPEHARDDPGLGAGVRGCGRPGTGRVGRGDQGRGLDAQHLALCAAADRRGHSAAGRGHRRLQDRR